MLSLSLLTAIHTARWQKHTVEYWLLPVVHALVYTGCVSERV